VSEQSYQFVGYINEEGSAIELSHWRPLAPLLHKYKDKRLIVQITEYKRHRSDEQNRYLHGPLVASVRSFYLEREGEHYETDEVKAILYQRVLGRKIVIKQVAGEEVLTYEGKRFSQMNTREFSNAVNKIFAYYDTLDWFIPPPPPRGLNTVTEIVAYEQGYSGDEHGEFEPEIKDE